MEGRDLRGRGWKKNTRQNQRLNPLTKSKSALTRPLYTFTYMPEYQKHFRTANIFLVMSLNILSNSIPRYWSSSQNFYDVIQLIGNIIKHKDALLTHALRVFFHISIFVAWQEDVPGAFAAKPTNSWPIAKVTKYFLRIWSVNNFKFNSLCRCSCKLHWQHPTFLAAEGLQWHSVQLLFHLARATGSFLLQLHRSKLIGSFSWA